MYNRQHYQTRCLFFTYQSVSHYTSQRQTVSAALSSRVEDHLVDSLCTLTVRDKLYSATFQILEWKTIMSTHSTLWQQRQLSSVTTRGRPSCRLARHQQSKANCLVLFLHRFRVGRDSVACSNTNSIQSRTRCPSTTFLLNLFRACHHIESIQQSKDKLLATQITVNH